MRHGMTRRDHYSDRYTRNLLELSATQLAEAKAGELDFELLEDVRFCLVCETFFAADFFISTIEHKEQVGFVCARCAHRFEKLSDADKEWQLEVCDIRHKFYVDELKMGHGDHRVGQRPMQCTPCFAAVAFRRY